MLYLSLLSLAALLLGVSANQPSLPEPPGLSYLFTAYLVIEANAAPAVPGPCGVRELLPIVGGNITGQINGEVLNSGADWVTVDPQTGTSSADARYVFNTTTGDFIFIRTEGGQRVDEYGVHLRIKLETGSRKFYWLNEIVAFGVLGFESPTELRIDSWHLSPEYNATSKLLL